MDIIEDHQQKGATVIYITHQMEEVERLCNRILLLKDGRAEAYGTVGEVQDRYGGPMIRLTYAGTLPSSPDYTIATLERNYAELSLTPAADPQRILRSLLDAGVTVRSFESGRTSMEAVFLRVYGADAAKEA